VGLPELSSNIKYTDDAYFNPLVLGNVKPGNSAFDDEIFGPVWSLVKFKTEEE